MYFLVRFKKITPDCGTEQRYHKLNVQKKKKREAT
jgi:hypothetical protein